MDQIKKLFGVRKLDGGRISWIDPDYNAEFRADAFNLTNSVSFFAGDLNINSATFGRITSTGNSSRVVQFTVRFSF